MLRLEKKLKEEDFVEIVGMIPDDWLLWGAEFDMTTDKVREVYVNFLSRRFENSSIFINTAVDERRKLLI